MHYHIKEVFWSSILSFLKSQKGIHNNDEARLRLFIEAVFYVLRTGCQWRMLPFYYGKYRSIHKRFKDWFDKGIFSRLFKSVQNPDLQEVMIDSTIARTYACSTGYQRDNNQAIGRSVGGLTTKIHAMTDALGNPIEILLSEGKTHDSKVAIALLQNVYNTKVIADRAYHHTYKLPLTISNCSNNYGPYQHPEKLIPVVINSCINYKPIPVYGDGSNIRDWLYVEDHCDAIQIIIEKGVVGEVYNIGGINEVDNLTLVKTICKLMDEYKPENAPHSKLITFVEDRKGHDWRYAIDNSKIQNELGWKPSQDFEKMFKQTIGFYLN
ncbi:dTDP-glucose 4,6-dehydratase [Allofrancisella inopinata]|uniref:IS5 family transposase n=1 Tax=Allofrancisella inopinata TaxID=1085647 RepID=A0AAE6YHA0_9GAMM|nr:IS5 family transposase [Allofrancisella inopinata]QIV95708.1 IS5 family transposase [Allofrancisella inopinata]TDT72166.1 dTDP-glucose 4,6-dehydratase [Allofrancisella inopinata]